MQQLAVSAGKPRAAVLPQRTFDCDEASAADLFHPALADDRHCLRAHRTFDPNEADFFYVPVYASCYAHPIYGSADWPWWHAPGSESRSSVALALSGSHCGLIMAMLYLPKPNLLYH